MWRQVQMWEQVQTWKQEQVRMVRQRVRWQQQQERVWARRTFAARTNSCLHGQTRKWKWKTP